MLVEDRRGEEETKRQGIGGGEVGITVNDWELWFIERDFREKVSERCGEASFVVWQHSDSPFLNNKTQQFERGREGRNRGEEGRRRHTVLLTRDPRIEYQFSATSGSKFRLLAKFSRNFREFSRSLFVQCPTDFGKPTLSVGFPPILSC